MEFRKRLINVLVITCIIIFLLFIILSFIYPNAPITLALQKNSTTVLSFLTLIYVLFTYYILKSNNEAQKEQLRPYVVVTFPIKYNRVYFSIKNIGRRPAKNLIINISPAIDSIQQPDLKGNCNTLLKQEFVAPNQEFINLVDLVPSILRNQSQKIFTISLKYFDSSNDQFSELQTIDLDCYLFHKISLNKDINDNLQILNEHLKIVSDAIKNKLGV